MLGQNLGEFPIPNSARSNCDSILGIIPTVDTRGHFPLSICKYWPIKIYEEVEATLKSEFELIKLVGQSFTNPLPNLPEILALLHLLQT